MEIGGDIHRRAGASTTIPASSTMRSCDVQLIRVDIRRFGVSADSDQRQIWGIGSG
jgi:hypothetical protein